MMTVQKMTSESQYILYSYFVIYTQVQWYYEYGQEIISNSNLLPPRYRIVSIPEVRQKSCSKIHATIIPPISTSLRFGIPCEGGATWKNLRGEFW